MNRKTIMAMPAGCFWSVIAACVLGIIIGSFRDFDINAAQTKRRSGLFLRPMVLTSPIACIPRPVPACMRDSKRKEKDIICWPGRC